MKPELSGEVHKERARLRGLAVRTTDVSRNLDIFLTCAVAGVLGNRFFLVLTGYPQLGNGVLHISHAIWGALMMATAIVVAVSFIAPSGRTFVAFVGGAGFGWFVDELGKFITRDTNYFFRTTLALIYIVFVFMYLVFRLLERRSYRPEEGLFNAFEALKLASIGNLDEPQRREALMLLDRTCGEDGLAPKVRDLLHHVTTIPPPPPTRARALGRRVLRIYDRWTERQGFVVAIGAFFAALAIAGVAQVFVLTPTRTGGRSFTQWATLGSSLVSLAFVAIGAASLRRSRLRAFRWFEASLLVAIFITQVFLFADRQLAGILNLAATLIVFLALRAVIRLETATEHTGATIGTDVAFTGEPQRRPGGATPSP
jgi:hypothetical protein